MTTVKESPNGHRLHPPPCSVPLQYEDGSEDSTRNDAGSEPSALGSNQLPDRCQFTFSDGRQCRMARSDIHPSLCRFHAEREDQLFGDPAPGGNVVGAALDLPELHSACRDLTTATGVNRALAQVFRLLAQRRISRQEAATFGHLAQLLLRSISLTRAESAAFGPHSDSSDLRPPGAGPVAVPPVPRANSSREANEGRTLSTPEPATAVNSSSQPEIPAAACELTPIPRTPSPASTKEPFAAPNPAAENPRTMNTYEDAEFKAVQNEHLRKIPGGHRRERHGYQELRGVNKVAGRGAH